MADAPLISAQLDWRQLNRLLKQVDDALYKDMRRWIVEAIEQSGVVGEARGAFPKVTGRSAATIRAVATARGGAIRGGGARAPGFAWQEFGGRHKAGRDGHTVSRPYVREGRYLTPRAMARRERVVQLVDEILSQQLSQLR